MTEFKKIVETFEKITGKPVNKSFATEEKYRNLRSKLENKNFIQDNPLGYSQFNELLLTLGYSRVTRHFFIFLFNHKEIKDFDHLKIGVDDFRKKALLLYGNIRYAFKHLSQIDKESFEKEINVLTPLEEDQYTKRHHPLHKLTKIPHDKAYYLGYIIQKQLDEQLSQDPNNSELLQQKEEMEEYRKIGWDNHQSYLVSDHMDVYIATSMRERYEFLQVNSFVKELFTHSSLQPLKLRYFDPTQAYCPDRIDKGLVEGLMIKRACCTIYHVQESDTFGKDSELAATLAQGKPVIAFIPKIPELDIFKSDTLEQIQYSYPNLSQKEGLLKRLQRYYPEGAWGDENESKIIRNWIDNPEKIDINEIIKLIHTKVSDIYEKRSDTLQKNHPLGLQVNLSTGVANGVLVVRSVEECAQLLYNILLNKMEFEIKNKEGYICLEEKISKSIYRVETRDNLLVNSFWNFYLNNNNSN